MNHLLQQNQYMQLVLLMYQKYQPYHHFLPCRLYPMYHYFRLCQKFPMYHHYLRCL